jgi:hypothetical protein
MIVWGKKSQATVPLIATFFLLALKVLGSKEIQTLGFNATGKIQH